MNNTQKGQKLHGCNPHVDRYEIYFKYTITSSSWPKSLVLSYPEEQAAIRKCLQSSRDYKQIRKFK